MSAREADVPAPVGLDAIRADLAAEQSGLDAIVAPRPAADWDRPTPSPRWTVADQIGHLTYFDRAAVLALTDPPAFAAEATRITAAPDESVDEITLHRGMPAAALLARWRSGRQALDDALATLESDTRVNWYGPPMGARTFVAGRLMEVWAHGQDVADALGVTREPTDRLRHVAHLGYATRAWSYVNRNAPVPEPTVHVRLEAPSGAIWTWGPDEAPGRITGTALDFCLVVTKRRHLDDTALKTRTPTDRQWLLWAQAFAGSPTGGPPPGRSAPI